jgi:hypothetical protein
MIGYNKLEKSWENKIFNLQKQSNALLKFERKKMEKKHKLAMGTNVRFYCVCIFSIFFLPWLTFAQNNIFFSSRVQEEQQMFFLRFQSVETKFHSKVQIMKWNSFSLIKLFVYVDSFSLCLSHTFSHLMKALNQNQSF